MTNLDSELLDLLKQYMIHSAMQGLFRTLQTGKLREEGDA